MWRLVRFRIPGIGAGAPLLTLSLGMLKVNLHYRV